MSDNLKEFIATVDCPFEWFAISSRIIDVEDRMLELIKL